MTNTLGYRGWLYSVLIAIDQLGKNHVRVSVKSQRREAAHAWDPGQGLGVGIPQ